MNKVSKKWIWVFAMILFLLSYSDKICAEGNLIYEYYNTGDAASSNVYGDYWLAQTFTVGATGHTVTSVKLKLYRVGSPGTVTVSIRATNVNGHPTGSDLTSGSIDGNSLTTDSTGAWYEIGLVPYLLSPNTKYGIVVRAPSGNSGNAGKWRYNSSSLTYSGGNYEESGNGGVLWSAIPLSDCMFEVWGGGLPPPPPPPPPPPGPTVGLVNPLFCKDIPCVIDAIINFIFYLGITIFTLMIIIGGIMYITSAGDPQKVSTAKRLFFWAVIGLAIILLAKGLISLIRSVLGGG
jgi:hypothetical protein